LTILIGVYLVNRPQPARAMGVANAGD